MGHKKETHHVKEARELLKSYDEMVSEAVNTGIYTNSHQINAHARRLSMLYADGAFEEATLSSEERKTLEGAVVLARNCF